MGIPELSSHDLAIILATTVPSVLLLVSVFAAVFAFYGCRARRRARLFRRGITPIEDDEIETWKLDRESEKTYTGGERRPSDRSNTSTVSSQKPPSVIVYTDSQCNRRMSEDHYSIASSAGHKRSIDLPAAAATARAPNARPGLTDDAVEGDDAYVSPPKRQANRLSKHPPISLAKHQRAWSTHRTSTTRSDVHNQWYGFNFEDPVCVRKSTDGSTSRPQAGSLHIGPSGEYYTLAHPARASVDDEMLFGGLSPRPQVHVSEIGRAIG